MRAGADSAIAFRAPPVRGFTQEAHSVQCSLAFGALDHRMCGSRVEPPVMLLILTEEQGVGIRKFVSLRYGWGGPA